MTHDKAEELADWTLEDLQEAMLADPLKLVTTIHDLAERCLQAESDIDELAGGGIPCLYCAYNTVDFNTANSVELLWCCDHCNDSGCRADFKWQGTHDMVTMEDTLNNG